MSYSIFRMQKLKGNAITGIQIHNQREKELANKDIDKEKTSLNYDLHNDNPVNYEEKFKEKIAKAGIEKYRSNAIKGIDILTTSDNDFFKKLSKEEQERYFKSSYDFICEKFGKDNVIASVVHLDERTPHMHTTIVPITEDNRLSAKDIMRNPMMLKGYQTDYNNYMNERGFELERGITSDRKHIELEEFKQQTKLQELEQELQRKEQSFEDKKKNLDYKLFNYELGKKIEIDNQLEKYENQRKKAIEQELKQEKSLLSYENEELKIDNQNLKNTAQQLKQTIEQSKEKIEELKQLDNKIIDKSKELESIENKSLQAQKELQQKESKLEQLDKEYEIEKKEKYNELDKEIENKKQAIPSIERVPTNASGVIATYQLEKGTFSKDYKISPENIEKLAQTLADAKTSTESYKKFENLAKSELESTKQEYKEKLEIAEKETSYYRQMASKTKAEFERYKENIKEFLSENKLVKAFQDFPAKQIAKQLDREFSELGRLSKEFNELRKESENWDNVSLKWDDYRYIEEKRAEKIDEVKSILGRARATKNFNEVAKNYQNLEQRIQKHEQIQSKEKEMSRGYERGGLSF